MTVLRFFYAKNYSKCTDFVGISVKKNVRLLSARCGLFSDGNHAEDDDLNWAYCVQGGLSR